MVKLGLRENKRQFILLVIINAFVGGMVGLERTILPAIAEVEFGMAVKTSILSFIVVFGIVKAMTNYFTGLLSDRFGRKNILVAGWLAGLPIPFMFIYATNWNWIVMANILLGINQGLTWSSTVIMKIDLVGEKERGWAMGLNEFAGYIAVAIVAFFTGWMGAHFGVRPYPFYLGIALVLLGLLFSLFLVNDTKPFVKLEAEENHLPLLKNIFLQTTLLHRNLGSVTQAGLINNLNDGMIWGLFPILLGMHHYRLDHIGIIVAVYPAVWGIGQLFTGKMSDFFCKKSMLFWGMLLQGAALLMIPFAESFLHFMALSIVLGWGTAMVYPTFLATIAENTHPFDRARSFGIFRFWRDLGYAIGAILTGLLADSFGLHSAVLAIGALTLMSAFWLQVRMQCQINAIPLMPWLFKKIISHPAK